MKKYIKYTLITLIILSILYFIYRFYEEKKVQEGFEGLDTQASSVYYKNTVDSNDLQTKIFSRNITKSVLEPDETASSVLNNIKDNFTGTWYNYNIDNSTYTPNQNDSILVLRRIGDQIQFTLSLNDINSINSSFKPLLNQDGTSPVSDAKNPYYSLIGMAQINTDDNTKATIISVSQNRYNNPNAKLIDGTVSSSLTSDFTTFIGESLIYDTSAKKITFLTIDFTYSNLDYQLASDDESNFGIGNKIFTYNKDIIQPYYEMEATQFSDVNCAPGKKLCTFTPSGNSTLTGYACTSGTVTNGVCPNSTSTDRTNYSINSDFMCSLGTKNSLGNYTNSNSNSNNNLSKTEGSSTYSLTDCVPQYNIVMNGKMDMMINKIDDNNGNLNSCTYLKDLTNNSKHYYILYFRNIDDVSSLSFQYWGESPNESRLVTIRTKLDQAIKNNTDVMNCVKNILGAQATNTNQPILYNKASNNSLVEWKLNKDLGNNSCYFTIGSKKTPTKPTYYLQSESNGLVHVSLFEGGINKYFTLEQTKKCETETYSDIDIYGGYLRASNGLYLSPGISSITELDPSSTNTDARVCTLVSKPNVAGKWIIISSSKSFTDDLSGLV